MAVTGTTGAAGVEELAALEETTVGGRARSTRGLGQAVGGHRTSWWRSLRVWRFFILIIAAGYFLIPLWAAFRFSVWTGTGRGWTASAYTQLVHSQGFGSAFWLSVQLALITTGLTLVLMVPTTIYVHLRLPRLRRVMDFVTVLPVVIPPVVLILGVLQVAPTRLKSTPFLLALVYVVLAMPFAYISLSAGLRAIDMHTLVDASRSLGGGWWTTLRKVLLPNMRVAVLSATVLTVALVLGEYTMASLDQYETFPVWIVAFEQENSHVSVAASLLALFVTWVVLMLISYFGRVRRGFGAGR
ncbi:MAG TPA: ABC transporter permease subunit [Acidimicrobiales bacterium]|nr:ABC transporter permease subunit [Acidimicrobiales bacterium]